MTKDKKDRPFGGLRTQMIHGGPPRSAYGETSEALYLTSGYVYESAEQAQARFAGEDEGFIYSRYGNPTVRTFEERMIALEGADDARATATGMAAVTASLLCFLGQGDHVVSARALFGSCRFVLENILPRYGIAVSFIDGTDLASWEGACRSETKAFFLETPSNPTLEIIDLAGVSALAKEVSARLIVDNVFATPILQKPLDHGADIVVYSATKHIDGQGRCLGGVILGDQHYIDEDLTPFFRNTGMSLSPFNAWVMLKGLETLDLRVRAHCQASISVAKFLEAQRSVRQVFYPGLPSHKQHNLAMKQMSLPGSLLAFEVEGDRAKAFEVVNRLRLVRISNNLGDAKSLITHPATTTHSKLTPETRAELGISDSLLRLSVGLEDEQDICDDLSRALAAAL